MTDNAEDIFLATKIRYVYPLQRDGCENYRPCFLWRDRMKLGEGDEVIGMQMASQGEYMLVASEKGYGKESGESLNLSCSFVAVRDFSAIM